MLARLSLFKKRDQLDSNRFMRYFSDQKLANALHNKKHQGILSSLVAVRLLGKSLIKQDDNKLLKDVQHLWDAYLSVEDKRSNLDVRKFMLEKMIRLLNAVSRKSDKMTDMLERINGHLNTVIGEKQIAWYENQISTVENIIIEQQRLGHFAHYECYRVAILNEELSKYYQRIGNFEQEKVTLLIAREYIRLSGYTNQPDGLEEDIEDSLSVLSNEINKQCENALHQHTLK